MPFNTRNPIPSGDLRDLDDNARNIDTWANDKTKLSHPDRFGVERRTWHGIEQEAQLNIQQAIDAKNAAQEAAMMSGFSKYADTLAQLEAGIGTDYLEGDVVMVFQDESRGDTSSIFKIESGAAEFKLTFDKTRQDLLSFTGTISADAEWSDVPAHSDPDFDVQAKALADRTEFLNEKTAISVTDFGARTTNTSAQNLAAFQAAEAAAGLNPIYVPDGIWQLTTPYDLDLKARYYGPGVLRFDIAEHKRRGGSSGSVDTPENHTLMFLYASQDDVSVLFDGVPQPIIWINSNTVQAPGSLTTTKVNIRVVNGSLPLGENALSVIAGNAFSGSNPDVEPTAPEDAGWFGTDNTGVGARSLMSLDTGVNNTGVGSKALASLKGGLNNTAVGFQSLYRIENAYDNTAVGSIAGEWLTTGYQNTLIGGYAGGRLTTGTENTSLGWGSLSDTDAGRMNVAVGLRALGNTGMRDPEESVAVGAFSGSFAYGSKNTFLGYRSGCGPNSGTDGSENVFVGFFAGRNQNGADQNTGVGVGALSSLINGVHNVALGHGAAESFTGSDITAIGYQSAKANISGLRVTAVGSSALAGSTARDCTAAGFAALVSNTTGNENTAFGVYAGQSNTTGTGSVDIGRSAGAGRTTGSWNVNVGRNAGRFLTTGNDNTNIGSAAGRLSQDGSNAVLWTNTTCVGASSSVSGSNQVQLGNTATTTYAYGAVQDRSDERDKADIRDTVLGLDFIKDLRAVDFKWDMRDDYVVTHEDGSVEVLPKDGSKKRNRYHHGLIAQEVREVMERHGVDFGGFQDHSVNGGCDVLSIGYTELIAPLIKAVQELSAKVDELESKMTD